MRNVRLSLDRFLSVPATLMLFLGIAALRKLNKEKTLRVLINPYGGQKLVRHPFISLSLCLFCILRRVRSPRQFLTGAQAPKVWRMIRPMFEISGVRLEVRSGISFRFKCRTEYTVSAI